MESLLKELVTLQKETNILLEHILVSLNKETEKENKEQTNNS